MKTIIISVVAFLLVAIGFGGYAYWMQGRLTDMAAQKTVVEDTLATSQAELQKIQAEKTTLETTLSEQANQEAQEALNQESLIKILSGITLDDLKTITTSSGATATGTTSTGTTLETATGSASILDTFYASLVHVEGSGLPVKNLEKYKLQLEKTFSPTARIIGYPVEMSQGDWTFLVALSETPAKNQVQLAGTGTTTPTATEKAQAPTQELLPILVRWSEGKIVEQYNFDYPGLVKSSKLPSYVK